LPEVGGDAVLYVDPTSVDSIRQAMTTMFSDVNLRKNLIDKAHIQRERFTWEKTADLLWKSIEKCL
jgi:glycosyltransferase involved in cell wall biosynthesis